jgi:uncharacterized protein YbbC (DUF1343 family)
MTGYQSGIDRLRAQGYAPLLGQRIGLLTNPAAVDAHYISTYQHLVAAPGVSIAALFGPEHGFSGAVAAGEGVADGRDARTGAPVYSLYGANLRPTPAMLTGLDRLVCDLPDIGVRYYTYLWTLFYLLEAAGQAGVPVLLLDRANPLGRAVRGPLIEPALYSIVGAAPVPIVHGLTIGELATLLNARWNPHPADLTVLPCAGYAPAAPPPDLPWAAPSPNMPHPLTARHYPGACLIEGTNLSEGRGTALPFEITGAPWIDGEALAAALNPLGLPGVRFRPIHFQPSASKWAGEPCSGVQAHLTDAAAYDPLRAWLTVIVTARQMYPAQFAWVVEQMIHFDRLIGSAGVRGQIEAGEPVAAITAGWGAVEAAFERERAAYLLYG